MRPQMRLMRNKIGLFGVRYFMRETFFFLENIVINILDREPGSLTTSLTTSHSVLERGGLRGAAEDEMDALQ